MSIDSEAKNRIAKLFDDGAYTELDSFGSSKVVTAYGMVNGAPCYAFSQNIDADGASMCACQAKKILRVYELAEKTGYPVVGIFDSNGGKLTKGIDAVSSYSELIAKAARLSGVVPQVAVIAGVCAASAAVWAMNSDVVVMTDEGELFVNAPSVLGDKKVGTADAAVANGTAHISFDSIDEAVAGARDILAYLPLNNLGVAAETDCVPATGAFPAADAAAAVAAVADDGSVLELRKGFGTDTVTAFARIAGESVGLVAAYGSLTADDCKKIASFVGLCDAFSIPVVTVIDTEGYAKCADGELDGMVKSASALTKAYAEATTAKIALISGKAYGSAFVTFAGKASGADAVYSLEGAVIAPMAPEAAATIVYKDRLDSGEDKNTVYADYIANDASAAAAAKKGAVDDVFAASETVDKLINALDMLASKRVSTLDKKHTVLSF